MKLALPPEDMLIVTSDDDVAEGRYYSSNPLVSWIYRSRLQSAVNMIEGRPKRLLEIGCGSGVLTPTLQKMAEKVVSVDIHDKLEQVNNNIPGNYRRASIFNLPFKEKFDCIVCLSVVEHLENFEAALQEVKKHLAPQGKVIWGVPSDNFLITFWFWLKKSPALQSHINSKKDILKALNKNYTIDAVKTLRLVLPDYYTVVRCS